MCCLLLGQNIAYFCLASFPLVSHASKCGLVVQCREAGPNGSQGGGAVLLVIKGTAHHTFTDVVPYFHARFGWLTKMVSTWEQLDHTLHTLCKPSNVICMQLSVTHYLVTSKAKCPTKLSAILKQGEQLVCSANLHA